MLKHHLVLYKETLAFQKTGRQLAAKLVTQAVYLTNNTETPKAGFGINGPCKLKKQEQQYATN